MKLVGSGVPYVGSDGRLWRDREEEMEYKGLLASPKSFASSSHSPHAQSHSYNHHAQTLVPQELRRGSAETDTSIGDEPSEDRLGRRQWARFGRGKGAVSASGGAASSVYDRASGAEPQRLRLPSSSATNSSDSEEMEQEAWSPLETHGAAHQFPAYVFPGASKSSRRSGNTILSSTASSKGSGRVLPLPVSMADFVVPDANAGMHVHPPRAKDEFLASSFVPPSSSRSKPPTSGAAREGRRASLQYPSRRRDEVHATEIDIPLPSIAPSHSTTHLAVPSRGSSSRPGTANSSSEGKEKRGLFGVFKKSSK